ncbi:MAG TPA: dienelactone hydrolase family protein [Frankiaceae bacterium]|nr:dienelactone hydrolase family protein [Frankiaceae bacterium]
MFAGRSEAGHALAARLVHLRGPGTVVLGLPRGGVPVAYEVARALGAPLDVVVVRKLRLPHEPEVAMGALGEGGVVVVNDAVVAAAGVTREEFEAAGRYERARLDARVRRLRDGVPPVPLTGVTAVLVDDGAATGATARAACQVVRAAGAARVVLAFPVASREALTVLRGVADEVVCLAAPEHFFAVGQWYVEFPAVDDDEVSALLEASRLLRAMPPRGDPAAGGDVRVPAAGALLPGWLTIPAGAPMTVVFAHGTGSGADSPRGRYVASVLQEAGLGTLLLDLLTAAEERAGVLDVELLAHRLRDATEWLRATRRGPRAVGWFGASTGAAAALWAVADPDAEVAAIVTRGGRPDLAWSRLSSVRAPTLLVVGGDDHAVLDLSRDALATLRCEARLVVVPGATHLFAERGTLRTVAELARDWFVAHVPLEATR